MEPQDKKKLLIGGTLAGAGAVVLFTLIFFTLGPAVFGQSIPTPESRYAQMFAQVMAFIGKNYVDEVDQQKLFDGAMKGMFESLNDPYSLYLTASDMMNLNDTTTGEFGGVGLYVNKLDPSQAEKSKNPKDKYVEVVAPIEDTPAYRAGILAGDYITKIDGQAVDAFSMDKVLSILRGKADTDVTVTILRGESTTMDFTLKRAVIQVPSVKTTWIEPDVAYLRITQFTAHTKEKFDEAIQEFTKKNFKKMVIDLRNNPGGLLDTVAKIGESFFKDGVIVSTKSRVPGESAVYNAEGNMTVPEDVRIVVLIDKGSASASEILSGALKDRKRAFLLGETTYGKGSVQQVIPFDKTGFKLTMARYYTPSGVNIDKIGITPNKVLKDKDLTDAELKQYKDLVQAKTLENFAKSKKQFNDVEIGAFVKQLKTSGITLEDRLLKRLVRLEILRAANQNPPVVDLDFDIVLKEAINLLNSSTFQIP